MIFLLIIVCFFVIFSVALILVFFRIRTSKHKRPPNIIEKFHIKFSLFKDTYAEFDYEIKNGYNKRIDS